MLPQLTPTVSAADREAQIIEEIKKSAVTYDKVFGAKVGSLWFSFGIARPN